jgi:hypothetical protein
MAFGNFHGPTSELKAARWTLNLGRIPLPNDGLSRRGDRAKGVAAGRD